MYITIIVIVTLIFAFFLNLMVYFKERKGGQSSHENKVEIEIYGLNNESLKKAFDEIQKELNKVVTERSIAHRLTDIPPNLVRILWLSSINFNKHYVFVQSHSIQITKFL